MLRRPSRSTRNYTLFPSTPLFRSLDDRRRAAGIAVEQGALRILRDIAQASGVGGIEKILADEADRLGNLLDRHRKPGRPAGVFAEVEITADDDRIALAFAGQIGRANGCTPVTDAHLVCRLLLENKTKYDKRVMIILSAVWYMKHYNNI